MKLAWREWFSIPPRSLAAFRIAVGIVLLIDLGIRAVDLGAMYTDDGMFPRTLICRHYSLWNWSLHFGGGSWWYQAMLFSLAAGFALGLMVGWETRLATVVSWVLLVSLHNRAPLILSGADNLLRLLLFWGMFLPLGRVWSVDAWKARRKGGGHASLEPVLSVASAGILLQVAMVYLFSAVFKSNVEWLRGGAIAAILADGFYGKPFATRLQDFPALLHATSVGVFASEWLAPFLLFSPIWTTRLRLGALALLVGLHLGIAALMNVGLFPHVSLAALLLFLPSSLWTRLGFGAGSAVENSGSPKRSDGASTRRGVRRAAFAAQGACAVALGYVVLANVNGLPSFLLPWSPLPRIEAFTVALGLGQTWDMFSRPPPRNGWCVANATLADGSQVDLLRRGAPVVWERPYDPASVYPNHRWLKLFRELSLAETRGIEVMRQPVAEYLGRDWNRAQPAATRVSAVALVFCIERKGEYGLRPIRDTLVHLEISGPRP